MSELLERLLDSAPVLLDGAWGTQLQARGLNPGDCPDAWNLLMPHRVSEVARAYVGAGSRVILTNTFGASRINLARHGLDSQTAEINRAGAKISHDAAASAARVFGSIGPSGFMLATGEITETALAEAFAEQASALADGGADGLVVETMSDLQEAVIAVRAAATTGLPVVACMTYDSGKAHDRTMMGITPEQAASALADAGASVIGANCGQAPEQMLVICSRLRAATNLPLWLKPNAGAPELYGGRPIWRTGPQEFAQAALALVDAGATFIGGCCGTSPEHVEALSRALGAR